MLGRLGRLRPTHATAVAYLALFVALGGTGYAAITLPANSVGTKQLKKRAVTGKKIRRNAVTSAKVKDASLLGKDFAAGQLPAGPKGDKGETGAPGTPGAPGEAAAFAGVRGDGTLFTPASLAKNIVAANISHPTTGVYCFHDLPFTPRSAMASGANGFGVNFTLASVEINGRDGGTFTGECLTTDQARVRTVTVPGGGTASSLQNLAFYVWFE
jgi:hypothetical protein